MSKLIELQGQIEKLQKQANDIKAREFDRTVAEIKAQMQAFGITVKDLTSTKFVGKAKGNGKVPKAARSTKGKVTAKKAGKPVEAKYRGPNGETWTGRGLAPKWLMALMAEGKAKEDFAINAT